MQPKKTLKAKLLFTIILLCGAMLSAQNIQLSVQSGHSAKILDAKFSPNGKLVATAGADHNIVVWEIRSGRQLMVLTGHKDAVNEIDFHPNGMLLASASDDSTVRIWSLREARQVEKVDDYEYPVKTIRFGHDGERLITTGMLIRIMDFPVNSYYELDLIARHAYDALAVYGDTIAFGGHREGITEIFSLTDTAAIGRHPFHATHLEFSPNGTELFGSSYYARLAAWKVGSDRHRSATGKNSLNGYTSVAVNEDYFCAGDQDGIVKVFDRKTWDPVQTLKAHSREITALDISDNGRYLVSTGEDGLIIVWEVYQGQIVKVFSQNAGKINCIEFTEDGNHLIYAYGHGMVRDWNLESNDIRSAKLTHSKVRVHNNWNFSVHKIHSIEDSIIKFGLLETRRSEEDEKVLIRVKQYDLAWDERTNELTPDEMRKSESHLMRSYFKEIRHNRVPTPTFFLDTTMSYHEDKKRGLRAEIEGEELVVSKIGSGEEVFRIETGHTDLVTSVRFNPKHPYLATASWDGLVKLWDLSTGKMISALGAYGEKDFIFIDSENHYFASKGALNKIAFRIGLKAFSFEQFDLNFNRPDIVLSQLPYVRKEAIINFRRAYEKRLQKLGIKKSDLAIDLNIPNLKLELPEQLDVKDGKLKFSAVASDKNHRLHRLHVLVNGVPEYGKHGKEISGYELTEEIELQLNPGINEVEVFVKNDRGKSSFKEGFQALSREKETAPDLYVIAIGASKFKQNEFDLDYAEKDARDISDNFRHHRKFGEIKTELLVNEQVTVENVVQLRKFMEPAGVNDVILLFAAGHGLLDTALNYYFASHDVDFNDPSSRGIPYETFDELMDQTKSRRKVMFLDACHSGEIDKDEVELASADKAVKGEVKFRNVGTTVKQKDGHEISAFELSKTLFADMRADNGSTVVSSSRGGEFAMEGKDWNNGVFTYCLLKGIDSKDADLNGDRRIMLSELQAYLLGEVGRVTGGMQTPTSRTENLINDFRIW